MYIIVVRADAKTSRNLANYAETEIIQQNIDQDAIILAAVLLEYKNSENQINPVEVPVEI